MRADGGVIQLTAHGKEALMDTVIDNTGILQARGLIEKMGVIHLDGGDDGVISQRGAIDVSNPQGRGGGRFLRGNEFVWSPAAKLMLLDLLGKAPFWSVGIGRAKKSDKECSFCRHGKRRAY